MNLEEIRELAVIMKENGLTRAEVTQEDGSVLLECSPAISQFPVTIPSMAAEPCTQENSIAPAIVAKSNAKTIKSPMVGVFYTASSPDAEPFIHEGDNVKKGDVLCVIEAMKLLNEITAETEGQIVRVCAENGALVEYGQALFEIC